LFDASNVTVETHFEQSLPSVYADESQLWQAVLNIIRNALEAMPTGGMLTLRTQRDADAVIVSIADTGKGMTVEERDQVFKPFFSTKIGGTGLGLPLTQQIVAEHGGHIRCESEPGKGTTFFIHLKFSQET
jgi:signal transduction histidine kinase